MTSDRAGRSGFSAICAIFAIQVKTCLRHELGFVLSWRAGSGRTDSLKSASGADQMRPSFSPNRHLDVRVPRSALNRPHHVRLVDMRPAVLGIDDRRQTTIDIRQREHWRLLCGSIKQMASHTTLTVGTSIWQPALRAAGFEPARRQTEQQASHELAVSHSEVTRNDKATTLACNRRSNRSRYRGCCWFVLEVVENGWLVAWVGA
jgi:hypothetical protein